MRDPISPLDALIVTNFTIVGYIRKLAETGFEEGNRTGTDKSASCQRLSVTAGPFANTYLAFVLQGIPNEWFGRTRPLKL